MATTLHAIGELITAEWIEATFDAEHIARLQSDTTTDTTTIGVRDGRLRIIDQHTEFTVGADAVLCIVDGRPSLWGGIEEDDPDGDGDSILVDRIVIGTA